VHRRDDPDPPVQATRSGLLTPAYLFLDLDLTVDRGNFFKSLINTFIIIHNFLNSDSPSLKIPEGL
jgi:hypothetical protein